MGIRIHSPSARRLKIHQQSARRPNITAVRADYLLLFSHIALDFQRSAVLEEGAPLDRWPLINNVYEVVELTEESPAPLSLVECHGWLLPGGICMLIRRFRRLQFCTESRNLAFNSFNRAIIHFRYLI